MFQIGEKVIVKTIEEMAEEDGCIVRHDDDGDWVSNSNYSCAFIHQMGKFCGKKFFVSDRRYDTVCKDAFIYELISLSGERILYEWHDYMLKSAEEKSFDIASEADIDCLYD